MICISKKSSSRRLRAGFSLTEAIAAIAVLGILTSSVVTVINRYLEVTAATRDRGRAFEVAQEKMENILAGDSVEESTDFGFSEKYPEIEWQTKVETFDVSGSSQMWVRAISKAYYYDVSRQQQTVELERWVTPLSAAQQKQIKDQEKKEQDYYEKIAEMTGKDVDEVRQELDPDAQGPDSSTDSSDDPGSSDGKTGGDKDSGGKNDSDSNKTGTGGGSSDTSDPDRGMTEEEFRKFVEDLMKQLQ